MAKKKKVIKAKEPVRMRIKELKNGNRSIYLDTYQNGKHIYEFLKLYLVPEVNEAAKTQNETTLQAANSIKAQRILDITQEKGGISKASHGGKMLLSDWCKECARRKGGNYEKMMLRGFRHLADYGWNGVTLSDVDKKYCEGYIDYLSHAKKYTHDSTRGETILTDKPINKTTVSIYWRYFVFALAEALKEDYIKFNPATQIDNIHKKETKPLENTRSFLTLDELKTLIATELPETKYKDIRNAFLFSCFCGLRVSDVENLRWRDIQCDGGRYFTMIRMKKTGDALTLPLSDNAIKCLPERNGKGDDDAIFSMPISPYTRSWVLKRWAKAAGITKDICYHMSRHTFATSLLTLGADLYTTSKLLGHRRIQTTQIYAEIVDKKKEDAVNLLNNIM